MNRRILSLWLPFWPIERHLKQQGMTALTGLALYAPERGRLTVKAADGIALRLGIRCGMPLAQARAMQPDLNVALADPAADLAALETLIRPREGECRRTCFLDAWDDLHCYLCDARPCDDTHSQNAQPAPAG